ncbi:MAG: hypothetical protein J0L56_14565 [Chitinophagales bacterium]|nr:hypothetical protein [Chitinophagales bacterium]
MKAKIVLLILILAGIFMACNKDKFTTTPQIKIKTVSPKTAGQGDVIEIRGQFTDEEGDLDSVFIVYKWYDGATATIIFDTIKNSIAGLGLPKNTREGDLLITFAYGIQIDGISQLTPTPSIRDTSATFGIVLKDKEANRSDYAESEKLRLIKF